MYIPRLLDISKKLQSKSHFLFGPRQTGKSSLAESPRRVDDIEVLPWTRFLDDLWDGRFG